VFPDSIYSKWSADWLKRLLQWQDAHDNYLGFLEGEAEELFEELGRKGKQPSWMKRAHVNLGRPSKWKLREALKNEIRRRKKWKNLNFPLFLASE
jgi:hypothetical protein